MEKPYYKSQLRLQKRKSDKLIQKYQYKYKTNILEICVEDCDTFKKITIFDNILEKDLNILNIYKLNIKRIIKEYKSNVLIALKWINKFNSCHEALLQCGFVLQYTKELGYHFIR